MYIKVYQRKYHILDLIIRVLCALLLIYCLTPTGFATHYEYIAPEDMQLALVDSVTRNISLQRLEACDYSEIIANNAYVYRKAFRDTLMQGEQIRMGGEYYPDFCRPRYSTAIIVPYRQREQQLHAFLTYIHNYLRQQNIHYRIFLVEQYDRKPFNRAKLFNIGALIAAQYGFPCLVLHDVDLLPLNVGQLYACTIHPRHMCPALDIFRFNLLYTELFGGVVAIRTEQFRNINGLSNLYEGWGGEDDDFFKRLEARNISICRFAPDYSGYTMLRHKPEKKNELRTSLLSSSSKRFHTDGLNSLLYEEKERRLHSLFTHILVET